MTLFLSFQLSITLYPSARRTSRTPSRCRSTNEVRPIMGHKTLILTFLGSGFHYPNYLELKKYYLISKFHAFYIHTSSSDISKPTTRRALRTSTSSSCGATSSSGAQGPLQGIPVPWAKVPAPGSRVTAPGAGGSSSIGMCSSIRGKGSSS